MQRKCLARKPIISKFRNEKHQESANGNGCSGFYRKSTTHEFRDLLEKLPAKKRVFPEFVDIYV